MTDEILAFLVAVGLAASIGLRISIPILIVSVFAYAGDLSLSTYFGWLGTLTAVIILFLITILEVIAYYIAWLDNFLDTIEHPLSIIAGIVIAGAVVTDFNPYLKWLLAILIGGGITGTINAATALIRLKTSAETGGRGNYIVSTLEVIIAIILSIVAILLPLIVGIITAVAIIYFTFYIRKNFFSPIKTDD